MKEIVIELLTKSLAEKLTQQEIEKLIEIPPAEEMGGFCISLFFTFAYF